jgi:hypothetical protein
MLLTALLGLACGPAAAQDAVVRGFITDASSGRPLVNANVVLQDATGIVQAAITDANGFYQLSAVEPGQYALRVSFVGYETERDTLRLSAGTRTVSRALTPITQELQGVTVEGTRDSIEDARAGLDRISPADIDRIPTPGPGSDLAGYLRSQPGVVTLGDRGGQLYVRGGTPSQNLILVDGTPVYKPFHIIGFYSAFPSDLVSSADFYAGGFGAEYMGRISSVLDVNLRAGNTKQNEAQAAVSPFVASVRAEGPLGWRRTSLLVHYRQSLIERMGSALINESTPYYFYDTTVKLHTQGDNSQCSFTGLRTYDRGRIDPDRPSSFRWANTSVGGDCLVFGEGSSQTVDVSFGATHFSNTVETPDGSKRSAGTWRYHTTFDLESPMSWGSINWGGWARADQYHFDLEELHLGLSADNDFAVAMGGYVEATWSPTNTLTVEPSFGAQGLLGEANLNFEPRLRLAWEPGGSGDTKLTAATGLYHQLAVGITDERDAGTSFLAWFPTPAVDRPLQALHVLGGWEQRLFGGLTAHIEGYYKDLRDIPVPTWTPVNRFNTTLSLADGTAYGADVRLEYQNGPLNLRAGYGWNWVEYRAARDDLGAWTGGDLIRYHPPHDQRHSLSFVGQLDTGLFEASARWQLSSGLPYTQVYGFDTLLELRGLRDQPTRDVGAPRLFYRQPYNERLPAYHRLDLSAERTFELSPLVDLTAEVGSINTYDRANIFYIDIFSLERVDQLPLLPYVALTVTLQ